MQNAAVIVDNARSPMGRGKPGGGLSGAHPADLLRQVLVGLVERNKLDPGSVDDLIMGCVSQAGEQAVPVGRTARLACLNPRGGAIALGHSLGASGTRLMSSMVNGLRETGGRNGLQTMCEADGLANATIVERF